MLSSAIALALPLYSKGFDATPLRELRLGSLRLLGFQADAWQLAPLGALILSAFATLVLFAILVSFRKTASEEIFFLAFWALSCSFESGRILVARFLEAGAPPLWIDFATRAVLAARFSGYGAFFLAGLRSAGFRNESPGQAVLVAIVIGTAAATALPLDSGSFDPILLAKASYPLERLLLVGALAAVTAANLLVAVEGTGETVFRTVALGALALLAGQALLVESWRPEALIGGLLLLTVGARLFVSRLHAHYLWQ